MELKQLKELMAVMEKAGIKKLMIKEKTGYEVHLERQEESVSQNHAPYPSFYPPPHPPYFKESEPHARLPSAAPAVRETVEQKKDETGKYVLSPMVGTFYSSPSPDDPPFVKVGDRVEEGTVLCIIEAMKVMNEVKAGMSGTIAEILIDNAHPVEFGTKLFRIS